MTIAQAHPRAGHRPAAHPAGQAAGHPAKRCAHLAAPPFFRGLVALSVALALAGCAPWPLACTAAQDVKAEQLHGRWTVQLGDSSLGWTLQLGPHPEHRGSLRGELRQGSLRYPVVADLIDGEFTMEESHDGQRIAATWLGDVAAGSCGRLLTGERLIAGQAPQAFRMRP